MISNSDGKRLYEGLIGRVDDEHVLMPDAETHRIRLMLASHLIAMTLEDLVAREWVKDPTDATYLDLGCGFGDLLEHCEMDEARYTGVEEVDWIREEAKIRHPGYTFIKIEARRYLQSLYEDLTNHAKMAHRKARRPFDFVIALGVLATMKVSEAKALIRLIEQLKPQVLLMSFNDRQQYEGMMSSFHWKEISNMLTDTKALDSLTIASPNPNDLVDRVMVVIYDWEAARV